MAGPLTPIGGTLIQITEIRARDSDAESRFRRRPGNNNSKRQAISYVGTATQRS